MSASEPRMSTSTNWDTWTPGSEPAARQADQLEQLIDEAVGKNANWSARAAARGSLLASIEDHRLDRLAATVSAAVARGDSVDELERTLQGVLDDSTWADLVATTEMNRAMTSASMASYATNGVPAYSILVSSGNPCALCQENADSGPYAMGTDPPNGLPPTHPRCLCSASPEYDTPSDLGLSGSDLTDFGDEDDLEGEADDESLDGGGESAGTFPGPVEPAAEVTPDTAGTVHEVEPPKGPTPVKPEPTLAPEVEQHPTTGSVGQPEPARGPAALDAAPEGPNRPDGWRTTTDDEREALRSYKGQGYANLNPALRKTEGNLPGGAGYAAFRDWVTEIDQVMARSSLTSDVEVNRALRDGPSVFGDRWDRSLAGATWTEYAYTSTTTNESVVSWFHAKNAPNPATLLIRVPAGTGAVELSGANYESELLLARGLQFRVVSDSGPASANRVIELEVVPR